MKKTLPYIILVLLLCWQAVLYAQERFPRPEFESGYQYLTNQMPIQRAPGLVYLDVAVLIALQHLDIQDLELFV
jgi:NosR/NirI family nitrous oxide reductase transcriptional regulator